MSTDELLRRASVAIQSGRLPRRAPDCTWGGFGIGAPCAVCEVTITPTEAELEVEFTQDGTTPGLGKFHAHPRCFYVWDVERKQLDILEARGFILPDLAH